MWIHSPPSTPTLEQTQPPSLPFSPHNILFFVVVVFFWGAAFSSSLLTVDCKCPNLGRQPFLITRITLLSDRKIKLNNSIAYSWSQTAALRTHQSPLKLFHAPPSTHTHTHAFTHKQPFTDNMQMLIYFLTCVTALAPHLVWSQSVQLGGKKRKRFFFCNIYAVQKKKDAWNEKFLWGFL